MRKVLPTLSAGVIAAALIIAPTAAASAATATATHPGVKPYTLTVTGNGTHAMVMWSAAKLSNAGSPSSSGMLKSAHEPWTKHVSAKDDIYSIMASQKTGTRISCTIRDSRGKVLSRSTSYGKHGIATCIVSTKDLFSGASLG
ncbi:hypothetical protein [Amnibacterium sp.]|uniref:hypothetical protein n=1 Tax=Amnibacterium sp. TaxID=1872496 RepID=UPI0026340E24|nr:hypothetical protein [Amnibacterium sp.]MCU1475184.1 hypothetical protein [Amnibacterium sp.]